MKYILLIILTLGFFHSFSQEKKLLLGFNLGPSITNLRGDKYYDGIKESYEDKNQTSLIRFAIGLTLEYEINNKLSIISGINFELKGGISTNPIFESYRNYPDPIVTYIRGKETNDYNLQYLTVPLLGSFKFGPKKLFFLNGGFFGSILAIREQRTSYHVNFYQKNTAYSKIYDAGFTAGIGGVTDLNKKLSFSFEVRNNLGLVNIVKTPTISESVIKTNSINILLGFSWRIGKSEPT